MNNPAKKGRELLRMARSQAVLNKDSQVNKLEIDEPVESKIEETGMNTIKEEIDLTIENTKGSSETDIAKENVDHENTETNNENQITPGKPQLSITHNDDNNKQPGLNNRLAMFENKTKQTDYKNNLLNRMNKDKNKGPTKIISTQENNNITNTSPSKTVNIVITPSDNAEQSGENKNETEDTTYPNLPQTKPQDKEKLMKRIASAKGMQKGLTTKNTQLGDRKISQRIMGLANQLQDVLQVDHPKKSFNIQDEDIQRLDDDNIKEDYSHKINNIPRMSMLRPLLNRTDEYELKLEKKDVQDIILDKPIVNVSKTRKATKKNFNLENNIN